MLDSNYVYIIARFVESYSAFLYLFTNKLPKQQNHARKITLTCRQT